MTKHILTGLLILIFGIPCTVVGLLYLGILISLQFVYAQIRKQHILLEDKADDKH